jgi:hypothetical protein
MKKFKVTMIGTSIKEIFVNAKNKEEAMDKVDKYYLDEEKINFNDEDIKHMMVRCKEIKSVRREKFFAKGYDLPENNSDTLISEILDTFQKSEKKICKDGYLELKLAKDDIDKLEKLYEKYKENIINL